MLERLEIVNFKAFARQEVDLKQLTLLTGLNSSGKSTVLQALALIRQSYDAGVLTSYDGGGFLLNGELVTLGTGQDVRHEAFVEDDPGISLAISQNSEAYRWRAEYGREEDLLRFQSCLAEPPPATALLGPGFQYLRADRIVPAVSYPRSHQIAVRRGFLGVQGEHTVNYLRARQDDLVAGDEVCRDEAPSRRLLDQTDAWMQRLCPGVTLETVGIDGTDTVRLSYGFGSGVDASNRYRPTNVGFGLTYALPIVVACLAAQPGALILLENPEAHLHPRGQTELAYLACRAAATGAQLIIETHSDHVLNGVRLAVKGEIIPPDAAAVHFFSRAGTASRIVSPHIDANGMLSQWPTGFFDEWENSLDKLLD